MAACGGPPPLVAARDRIVVIKSEQAMILMHGAQVLKVNVERSGTIWRLMAETPFT